MLHFDTIEQYLVKIGIRAPDAGPITAVDHQEFASQVNYATGMEKSAIHLALAGIGEFTVSAIKHIAMYVEGFVGNAVDFASKEVDILFANREEADAKATAEALAAKDAADAAAEAARLASEKAAEAKKVADAAAEEARLLAEKNAAIEAAATQEAAVAAEAKRVAELTAVAEKATSSTPVVPATDKAE